MGGDLTTHMHFWKREQQRVFNMSDWLKGKPRFSRWRRWKHRDDAAENGMKNDQEMSETGANRVGRHRPGVNLMKRLQVQFSSVAKKIFSNSKTMATIVNYTCKNFFKLNPGCRPCLRHRKGWSNISVKIKGVTVTCHQKTQDISRSSELGN